MTLEYDPKLAQLTYDLMEYGVEKSKALVEETLTAYGFNPNVTDWDLVHNANVTKDFPVDKRAIFYLVLRAHQEQKDFLRMFGEVKASNDHQAILAMVTAVKESTKKVALHCRTLLSMKSAKGFESYLAEKLGQMFSGAAADDDDQVDLMAGVSKPTIH